MLNSLSCGYSDAELYVASVPLPLFHYRELIMNLPRDVQAQFLTMFTIECKRSSGQHCHYWIAVLELPIT